MNINSISRVRKYLTESATKTLVHALVTSKLDYANVLLYGVPPVHLRKLQRVQNMAACVICKLGRYDCITPAYKKLHWLPVAKQIELKMLVYTYKALHDQAPGYLSDLIQPHNPPRSLRSGNKMLLTETRTNKVHFGDRAFSRAAPVLWNKLPIRNIGTF